MWTTLSCVPTCMRRKTLLKENLQQEQPQRAEKKHGETFAWEEMSPSYILAKNEEEWKTLVLCTASVQDWRSLKCQKTPQVGNTPLGQFFSIPLDHNVCSLSFNSKMNINDHCNIWNCRLYEHVICNGKYSPHLSGGSSVTHSLTGLQHPQTRA